VTNEKKKFLCDRHQVAGGHVVRLVFTGDALQVVHQESQGVEVRPGQTTTELSKLGHGCVFRYGRLPARRRAELGYPYEVSVQVAGEERLRQLSQVQFEDVCNDWRVDIGQVDELGPVLEGLTKFLDFGLGARHSVDAFELEPAGLDLVNAFANEGRDLRARFLQVLREVHPERRHLSRQPFVAALKSQRLQTLLVRRQSAILTVVSLEIDSNKISLFLCRPKLACLSLA
jgi:hypothetical protein